MKADWRAIEAVLFASEGLKFYVKEQKGEGIPLASTDESGPYERPHLPVLDDYTRKIA
jgi:hypothetical protein